MKTKRSCHIPRHSARSLNSFNQLLQLFGGLCISVLILFPIQSSSAQQESGTQLKFNKDIKTALLNIEYLCKDTILKRHFRIDSFGIRYYSHPLNWKPDFTIYWTEVDYFKKYVDTARSENYSSFLSKKNKELYANQVVLNIDSSLDFSPRKIKIALDPGQVATTLEEALTFEGRYVRIPASKLGMLGTDVELFESKMNHEVGRMVKDMLEREGYEVFMTKEKKNVSPLGSSFTEWAKKEWKQQLAIAVASGNITQDSYQYLLSFAKPSEIFSFYKLLDLRKRSELINKFRPDFTIAINLNASEKSSSHYSDLSISPVDDDFNMAFIPGGFTLSEVQTPESKLNFIRLLLSDDFTRSISLAAEILEAESNVLHVPVLSSIDDQMISNYCIKTDVPGLYTRNLYMLRSLHSPSAYLETIYQDSFKESQLLALQNYKYEFHDKSVITTSYRLYEVAKSIVIGVHNFCAKEERRLSQPLATQQQH